MIYQIVESFSGNIFLLGIKMSTHPLTHRLIFVNVTVDLLLQGELFDAPTRKKEATENLQIPKFLESEV